jgi:hypothetical protein
MPVLNYIFVRHFVEIGLKGRFNPKVREQTLRFAKKLVRIVRRRRRSAFREPVSPTSKPRRHCHHLSLRAVCDSLCIGLSLLLMLVSDSLSIPRILLVSRLLLKPRLLVFA